jgi:iron complex outermembrane receptor protein
LGIFKTTRAEKSLEMKRLAISFCMTLLWVLTYSLLPAQDNCQIQLSGYVIDEHDDEPLPYANLFLIETQQGTSSDSTGYFQISNICPNNYTLRLSHIGCESKEIQIQLISDLEQDFVLEHHAELLDAITVKEKKLHASENEVINTISQADMERFSGKSLGEMLTDISGVETLSTGPNIFKPVIHGMHGSRVVIYNQGLRLQSQEWGSDHSPEVDPYTAGSLSVIKGASAVRYGVGSIGGVVLINPAPMRTEPGIGGDLDFLVHSNGRGISNSLSLDYKPAKRPNTNIRWQSSFKKSGDFHAPDYQLTNTGFNELNSSLRFRIQKPTWQSEIYYSLFNSEMGILASSHIGNLTDLEQVLQSKTPLIVEDFSYDIINPKQKVIHHLLKARWTKLDLTPGILEILYGIQLNIRKEFDIRRGGRSEIPALDMSLLSNSLEANFKHNPTAFGLTGQLGFQSDFQTNRNNGDTGVTPLIPWYNSLNLGFYWIEKWTKDKLTLESGLRFDYRKLITKYFDDDEKLIKDNRNFRGVSANISALYLFQEHLSFISQLNYSFRPPNISELYSDGLHHAVASIEEGDVNLVNEKSLKWINSFHLEKDTRVHAGVDLYIQHISNYIYLQPSDEPRLTIRGAFPVFVYQQTDARVWGIDSHINWEFFHDLLLRLKGSIVRADDLEKNEALLYFPGDKLSLGISYLVHGRYVLKDIQFLLESEFVSRQKRVDPELDFLAPPDAYNLINFETSFRWALKENEIHIHFKIENLLNTSYRDYLNRLRYYADEKGRNIELRLHYNF